MSKPTRTINTLLFDWDGTLADSAALGLVAYQRTFAELGVEFRQDVYEATYSPNWFVTYEALGLPKEKWQLADELWVRHYGEETAGLVEGGKETILDLCKRVTGSAWSAAGANPELAERLIRQGWIRSFKL